MGVYTRLSICCSGGRWPPAKSAPSISAPGGIPVFGLDALSSAAYGPEAALTLLIPLGLLGVKYIVPVSTAIVILLVIVYFSYRQTIEAYPHGGGSYTVASQNLGEGAGLLAAAALMIDYILTAAVGISAGVGALISAVPSLQPHTLALCLIVLAILTIVNMRGVHDTGVVFMIPTYLFTATLLIVIAVGGWQVVHAAGGHPHPVTPLPHDSARDRGGELVAAAEGLLLGLHGHDGRGGGEQWRDGLPRPRRARTPRPR
jgi:amino acid transporter